MKNKTKKTKQIEEKTKNLIAEIVFKERGMILAFNPDTGKMAVHLLSVNKLEVIALISAIAVESDFELSDLGMVAAALLKFRQKK